MSNLAVIRPEIELVSKWEKALDLAVAAGDLSSTSGATYQRGMAKFVEWAKSAGVELVTPDVIQTWKADLLKRGMKPTAVNTWLAGVRRFFAWSVGSGALAVNPTAGVKGVKRRNTGKKHLRLELTDHEVLRVLAQPDRSTSQGKRDYCILALKAFTGVRDVEVYRADVADLDTVDGIPVLHVQGKGSTEKDDLVVVYHGRAQEALYDWLAVRGNKPGALFWSFSNRSQGERLGLSAIRHTVIGYYRAAGIVDPRKTSHSLRHSAISKIARKDVLKARQVARHASLNTTMVYVHEADRLDNPGEAFIDYVNGQ